MPAIRRQINIAAPRRAVWNALTTAEGLTGWLAREARLDPRQGGRVVLTLQVPGREGPVEQRGIVFTWRPTSHLEIHWDSIGDFPGKGSVVSFQLAADGQETRVSLVQSNSADLDDEAIRSALDRAWKAALETLQARLDEPQ